MTDRHRLRLSDTVPYQIRIQGSLDESWDDYLGGQVISTQGEEPAVTTLVTPPVDQAALVGLISRLYGLGLPLLSVKVSRQIAANQPPLGG